jgi:signal transduction histidine kinase
VVEAHRGRIWIEDTPGGGATFVIALPLEEQATGKKAKYGSERLEHP